MDKDQLFIFLTGFKGNSMDLQGSVTVKLHDMIDRISGFDSFVSHGGSIEIRQCSFCCVAPGNEHHEDCPVRLARELKEIVEETVS